MPYLSLKKLSSKIDDFLLDNINLDIQKNEYFVLLGQSGSGKTKLLETIAGLIDCTGSIQYLGKEISFLSPEKRNIGFVYQDFALFPNLNVEQNIKFASRYKTIENEKEIFDDIVEFLKLGVLLKRDSKDLSGGEKQRVAIARALYSRPKILLLDEPLSAIDPTFRNSIMKNLKDIHKRYNLTTIHVTHNFREASYLADKIAVIKDGKILQTGKSDEVLNFPKSIDVARFLGFKNIFPSELLGHDLETKYFSIDPNMIRVEKVKDCDYVFEGEIEEFMKLIDHFKIFINVLNYQFFVKLPKREYEDFSKSQNIKIGFNKKDVCFI